MIQSVLILITVLWSILPIEKIDRSEPPPLAGNYIGYSRFQPSDSSNYGYAEVVDIWFQLNDSTYFYGLGDAFPVPGPTPEYSSGRGPYSHTDSTVTFEGAYPKILRPAVILYGTFTWNLTGDTLTLASEPDSPIPGRHTIRLIREDGR
jgi:hypothetical protein